MFSKSRQAVSLYRVICHQTNLHQTVCGCQLRGNQFQRSRSESTDVRSEKGQGRDALQKMREHIKSRSRLQHTESKTDVCRSRLRPDDLTEVKVQEQKVKTFSKNNSELAVSDDIDKTEITTFKKSDHELALKDDSEKTKVTTFLESDSELAVNDKSDETEVMTFMKSDSDLALKDETEKTKVVTFKENENDLALKDDSNKTEVMDFINSDNDLVLRDDWVKTKVTTFKNQETELAKSDDLDNSQVMSFVKDINQTAIENKTDDLSVMPHILKKEFHPSYNIAPYVNESETLSSLVQMGVSLAEIEKKEGAADIIIKMDLQKDLKPFLFFLKNVGVTNENIGKVITKNPYALQEDLENLKVRINYFRSKKFSADSISTIVSRNAMILSMSVEKIDAKLGFLQHHFKLKGNDVRSIVTKCPRLITTNKEIIKDRATYIEDDLGFSKWEVRQLLLSCPRVLITSKRLLGPTFDLLHNVMDQSHKDILRYPQIFRTRTFIIEQRHRYLLSLGRAQYDPTKENYVFIHNLAKGSDAEFCENIAKTTTEQFDAFIKTL